MHHQRAQWSSRLAFILATSGGAVGLGNIWKFPYIAGENGGGAFVLIYLLCIVAVGVPILIAEILFGRRGNSNPADCIGRVTRESGHSYQWKWVGVLCIATAFIILSYYSVVAGWTIHYIWLSISGQFTDATPHVIGDMFSALNANVGLLILYHTVMMLAAAGVVGLGVKNGLERSVIILLPIMLVLLIVLVLYAVQSGFFARGLDFLFAADFSKLSPSSALIALGHAFFTLGLGAGLNIAYGSYLSENISIGKTALIITFIDTAVALLAGLAIFPLVFANHLEPGMGPGLIFQTLPLAFGHMHFGGFFAVLFFIMLFLAAFTSGIGLLEPIVAWVVDHLQWSRIKASCVCGFGIWLLGLATVFSLNIWKAVKFKGYDIFGLLDYLTANITLPLGGLLLAVLAGYFIKQQYSHQEMSGDPQWLYHSWHFLIRYITPLAILCVFLNAIGILPV